MHATPTHTSNFIRILYVQAGCTFWKWELVRKQNKLYIYIYIYIYNSICFNKWHYFHQPSFYDIYIYIYIYISEKVCERSIASYLCFELYILTIVFMVQTCKLSHSVWGLRPEGQGCRVKIIGILTWFDYYIINLNTL